jgi:hypothetical protein
MSSAQNEFHFFANCFVYVFKIARVERRKKSRYIDFRGRAANYFFPLMPAIPAQRLRRRSDVISPVIANFPVKSALPVKP